MKRKTNTLSYFAVFLLSIVCMGTVFGQTYRLGDLYTFSDGSRGIVIYVDPDDASRGTVAALNDLNGPYAMWTETIPSAFRYMAMPVFSYGRTTSWVPHGSIATRMLYESGVSPAAEAIDVANGWYIPDAIQLRRIFGLISILSNAFEEAGGDVKAMMQHSHWSSTRVATYVYAMSPIGNLFVNEGTDSCYVRPVRDFHGDTVRAYWVGSPPKTDTTVSPSVTTTYDAHVVFQAETLTLTSTVSVHSIRYGDTLYETVSVSPIPYTSQANPVFGQMDISSPGEYFFKRILQAENGCDSVVTLKLDVIDHEIYTDTLCSLTEEYYFAPLDTVFLPGTVSGRYVHHGTKVVDGVSVDTTAYFDLTILPVYENYDTLAQCLYASEESLVYEPNEWVDITVAYGVVTVVSTSEELEVEVIDENRDYLLRMQTVHGCDSLLYLHLNIHEVARDTILYELPITNVVDNHVTAACLTFENIQEPGTYVLSDTLLDEKGCDSIVVVVLTVNSCELDFAIACPPDIYDTLSFGECEMTIPLGRIGVPSVVCDEEWPFIVSNDIPDGMMFAEGETLVVWTVTDSVCGISKECRQRVSIVFPQCPEAVDCEGNMYQSVRIGCDCWTQRNLESTKYSDCTGIPGVYEYANWLHPDTAGNVAVYGRLYTFEAAVRDSADNGHGHIQGICPEGWYLPTPDKYIWLNTYGAQALKSPQYWVDGGGDNSTGFSALPAGYFNGEKNRFEGLLSETYFWSSRIVDGAVGESLFLLRHHCDDVLESLIYSGLAYSVRCIKER